MKRAIGLVLIFAACLVGFLTVKGAFPFKPIFSNSLKPEIQYGSLVVIKPVQPENIKVGDIIIYNVPSSAQNYYNFPPVVAHRVVEVETEPSLGFRTKGNNTGEDPFIVPPANIQGLVGLQIPHLGLPLSIFMTTLRLVFISLTLILLALVLYYREMLPRVPVIRDFFIAPAAPEEKQNRPAPKSKTGGAENKIITVEKSMPGVDENIKVTSNPPVPSVNKAAEKKITATEQAKLQPDKGARKKISPISSAPDKSAPPNLDRRFEDFNKEAANAEKELHDALDRLNNMLKKYKN
jgi:signal peptidase I